MNYLGEIKFKIKERRIIMILTCKGSTVDQNYLSMGDDEGGLKNSNVYQDSQNKIYI